MSDKKELIEDVLKKDPQDIAFEPIPEENDSPLAQPVVQKNNPSGDVKASEANTKSDASKPGQTKPSGEKKEEPKAKVKDEPTDAPQQEINADPAEKKEGESSSGSEESSEFTIPIGHANMMVDSIFGVVNNTLLEVGAGYFIKIRKHKDFYDFDEVIQVIEEQNGKNIKRIKLDEEDKTMLRPLLIHVLRKQSKILTPEQQLLGVCISIIIKKAKAVMEIRVENEILVERIRDIIRKEVHGYQEEEQEEQEGQEKEQTPASETSEEKKKEDNTTEVEYEETTEVPQTSNRTGLPDAALETAA